MRLDCIVHLHVRLSVCGHLVIAKAKRGMANTATQPSRSLCHGAKALAQCQSVFRLEVASAVDEKLALVTCAGAGAGCRADGGGAGAGRRARD